MRVIAFATAAATTTVLALSALCSPLLAQGPGHLIALTRNNSTLRQQDPASCAFVARCTTPMGATVQQTSGGTAYDAAHGGVWISNGTDIALVHAETCSSICPPAPVPWFTTPAEVTGLALNDSTGVLFILGSNGELIRARNTCPLTFLSVCDTGLAPGPNQGTTGLAVDESLGLLFMSYADFTTNRSRIVYSSLFNPCNLLGRDPVGNCSLIGSFGAATGLAVDWCQSILYVTDGFQTQGWSYSWNPGTQTVSYTPAVCCVGPIVVGDPAVGLCIRPPLPARVGQPCNNGSCPPCPMIHRAANDPVVGNPDLRLTLEQGPGQSFAWLVIGQGPCGPASVLPPLCGPILAGAGNPLLVLGFQLTGFTLNCTGSASWSLNVPMSNAFCGTTWSSQVAVLCPSPTNPGTSLSNCLTWTLTGS